MNDEFLNQFRETPRAEFAETLYQRVSRQTKPHLAQKIARKLISRNFIIAFALLLLIALPVYAAVEARWNKVGEIWVDVQSAPKSSLIIQSNLYKGFGGDDKGIFVGDMEVANLAEAKAILKFEFTFPSWAPEGFTTGDRINIFPWSEKSLSAFWDSQDGGGPIGIFLDYRWRWVGPGANPMFEYISTWPVAPGSFKEVKVRGHPAVLVRGDWDWRRHVVEGETTELESNTGPELHWDEQNGLSLYWTESDVAYLLWTYNPAVTAEDLIKMAESAR